MAFVAYASENFLHIIVRGKNKEWTERAKINLATKEFCGSSAKLNAIYNLPGRRRILIETSEEITKWVEEYKWYVLEIDENYETINYTKINTQKFPIEDFNRFQPGHFLCDAAGGGTCSFVKVSTSKKLTKEEISLPLHPSDYFLQGVFPFWRNYSANEILINDYSKILANFDCVPIFYYDTAQFVSDEGNILTLKGELVKPAVNEIEHKIILAINREIIYWTGDNHVFKSLIRLSPNKGKTTIDLNIQYIPVKSLCFPRIADDLILFCRRKNHYCVDVLADFSNGSFKLFNEQYCPGTRYIFGVVNTSEKRHHVFEHICSITNLPTELVVIVSEYYFY